MNRKMHSLGGALRRYATLFQRNGLDVKTEPLDKLILKTFLAGWGYDNVTLSDEKYYLTDWENWKIIIEDDLTNSYKYIADSHDCDNFSDHFNALVATTYGLNTSGRLSVELFTQEGKHIGWHRCSIIVAKEGTKMVGYVYDPMINMHDGYCKIGDGEIRIKNWIYEGWYASFN